MAQMTWEEIAEQLIRDLQKGKYTSGEKLPSENKLAGELQVSRAEVRKAYSRSRGRAPASPLVPVGQTAPAPR